MKWREKGKSPAHAPSVCPGCGLPLENHGWRQCPRCRRELESCGGCGNCKKH